MVRMAHQVHPGRLVRLQMEMMEAMVLPEVLEVQARPVMEAMVPRERLEHQELQAHLRTAHQVHPVLRGHLRTVQMEAAARQEAVEYQVTEPPAHREHLVLRAMDLMEVPVPLEAAEAVAPPAMELTVRLVHLVLQAAAARLYQMEFLIRWLQPPMTFLPHPALEHL